MISLTNYEIKDIMIVIKSLEKKIEEFYYQELLEKLLVKKEDFYIFLDH